MLRVFFALQPAPERCREVVEYAAPWVASLQAQTVPAENLHATLCFIGAVPQERLDALRAAGAAVRAAPVTLNFDALEFWVKPRIICATAPEDAEHSALSLAQRIAEQATSAGFTPDVKPFRPHLTLARKVNRQKVESLVWPQPIAPGIVVRCEKFVLMESRRGERGSIYSVVDSWPLYAAEGH